MTEDTALARRLKRRDPQALAELYDRYGRAVYFVTYRVVEDQGAAEDLVQETFLRVWNNIATFDSRRASLGRWILAVARHQAIDYVRSCQGRMTRGFVPVEDWNVSSSSWETHAVERLDRNWVLGRALAKLSDRQRALLKLAFVEGLTHVEMATQLALPLGTVKTWIRGALQALRVELA
jgi:RNA polymerase sigma-70 factor (ECF subfamily)